MAINIIRDAGAQQAQKARAMQVLGEHPFRAPWWLRNGHAQTVWAPMFRSRPRVVRRIERIDTPDEDFLQLHVADGEPGLPAVLLLHGLEGSAESTYILGLCAKLQAIGWTAVAMEHRGCGGEMNRARRLYHSGETSDLAFVAERLAAEYKRVYVAGFSLGGNVLGKWLGESARNVPGEIRGAAIVSAPYDLTISGPHIDRVLGGFYARHFLRSLMKKTEAKERQYPGCVELERVRAAATLRAFDNDATAVLHGFRDVDHYYETQGCGQFLQGIGVPTLLVNSADDPFNPASTLPRKLSETSAYLHPAFTESGGHVGFVYGTPGKNRYWAEEQIMRFFQCYDAMESRT